VNKAVAFSWLRDYWLMDEQSIHQYAKLAHSVLTAKEVPMGFLGSLSLPNVPNNVALVTMCGPMLKADSCGALGYRTLSNQLNAAANNPEIQAIILLAESCPGGQSDGCEEFANAIASANKLKPVVGAVSGISCSAGMWAQTQCAEIYATNNTDILGCIGTMGQIRNPNKKGENEDYVYVVSDLSPDKNAESDDEQKLKQNILNPLTALFHQSVTNGRGDRLKLSKENVLSGKTYVAAEAVKYGLIDGIMPFNKIVSRALLLARSK
jgi:protease-4